MKKALLIIGLVLGISLAGLVGLVLLGFYGVSSRPPTAAEKLLVVSPAALEEYGTGDLNQAVCETWNAKRNIDGSLEVEVEYESEKDPAAPKPLYMSSTAEINLSRKSARESFPISIAAYRAGLAIAGDTTIQKSGEDLKLGDQSYMGTIKCSGKPVGTLLVIRQGKVVHSLVISGLYFGDAATMREVMAPVLLKSVEFQMK